MKTTTRCVVIAELGAVSRGTAWTASRDHLVIIHPANTRRKAGKTGVSTTPGECETLGNTKHSAHGTQRGSLWSLWLGQACPGSAGGGVLKTTETINTTQQHNGEVKKRWVVGSHCPLANCDL